jgi:hypothetical protein
MKKIFASLAAVVLLVSVAFSPPLASKSAPAIVAIVATVTTVTTAVLVYDYNSCDISIIWGCGNGGNGNSNNGSNNGQGGNNSTGQNNNGQNSNNNNGSNNGQSGQACSSTANSCGMTATGFTNAQGVCGATPPPASSCPTPTFEEDLSAEPALVREGERTTLNWEVSSATVCSLNGGGLNLADLDVDGSRETNPIMHRTEFTLTCVNGDLAAGAPSVSQTVVVNTVPAFQEI